MSEDSLELSTLVDDMPEIGVKIDGVFYPYGAHWRWSLLERAKFGQTYSKILDIERLEKPTQRDEDNLTKYYEDIVGLAVPTLPIEVWRALPSDHLRSALILDFLTKSGRQIEMLVPKDLARLQAFLRLNQPSGEKSSPGSNPRTAAIKRNG